MEMPGRIPTAECFRTERVQKNHTDARQYARSQNDTNLWNEEGSHVAIFTNLSVLAPSLLLETTQTRRAGPNEGLAIRKATLDFPQKRIRNRK